MDLQEFIKSHATTLQKGKGINHIKLPISDLGELGQMQQALLGGIAMLTQLDDDQRKEVENTMYWLCRILLAGHPQDELEGLAEWLREH